MGGQQEHEDARRLVRDLGQPVTASHVARQEGMARAQAARLLRGLAGQGLLRCLNPTARRSRLYWLTTKGERRQRALRDAAGLALLEHEHHEVDWELSGWVCYRHRAAILRALEEPLQPATIKRKAHAHDPTLRMSANNVRDVIRLFKERGIVRPVTARKRKHPRYELTRLGRTLQRYLLAAESRILYTATTRPEHHRSP